MIDTESKLPKNESDDKENLNDFLRRVSEDGKKRVRERQIKRRIPIKVLMKPFGPIAGKWPHER